MKPFESPDLGQKGYLAVPDAGTGPGVLVLHAWWGLTDDFTRACDRLARNGFVAYAPDLHRGETATTPERAKQLLGRVEDEERIEVVTKAFDYLLAHPATRGGAAGVVGFSMGAAYGIWLSTLRTTVAALVLFYGGSELEAFLEELGADTKAAIVGHFAETDEFEYVAALPGVVENLRSRGMNLTFNVYPGTHHWFAEESRPDVYDPEATELAWGRTVAFLRDKLAGESL